MRNDEVLTAMILSLSVQLAVHAERAHEVLEHPALAGVVRRTGFSRRSTRGRSRIVPLGVRRSDTHLLDENKVRSLTSHLPLHERKRANLVLLAVLQEGGARLSLPRLLEELEGSAHKSRSRRSRATTSASVMSGRAFTRNCE